MTNKISLTPVLKNSSLWHDNALRMKNVAVPFLNL